MSSEVTWLGITKDQMAEQLRSRFSVEEVSIPRLVDIFSKLASPLKDEFRIFWETGEVKNSTSVRGYNVGKIVEEKSIEPIGAFSMMNWLIEDPKAAEDALQHRWSRYSPS